MDAVLATATTASTPLDAAWRLGPAPPRLELAPFTRAELDEWFRGGQPEADACEKLLVWAARARAGLDLAIGEGARRAPPGRQARGARIPPRRLRPRGPRPRHELAVARELMPGSSRVEQLEALAQEYLAEFSTDGDADEKRPLGPGFRASGLRPPDSSRAALEAETERWAALPTVGGLAAPDVRFDDDPTTQEIDRRLRALARLRAGWDDLIGFCAHAVRRSGMPGLLGFASFRHYIEERLQLPPRTVEQREALEKRLWSSPALQEARRQGLSYEKLRVLSRLPEADIAQWVPRALATTCIALRRSVDGDRERQMRAARKLVVPLPRRVAVLLAAAAQAVRERFGRVLSTGRCLAVVAHHFVETWKGAVKGPRTRAQKVRDRDEGCCQVPGCSRRAPHSHHVLFRSHGGSDDPENQVGLCAFHHLRCIHGGYLVVVGRAPDALTWLRGGMPWTGT